MAWILYIFFDYFTTAPIYHFIFHFYVSFCVGNFGPDSNLFRILKISHMEIVLYLQISEIAVTVNNIFHFNSSTVKVLAKMDNCRIKQDICQNFKRF